MLHLEYLHQHGTLSEREQVQDHGISDWLALYSNTPQIVYWVAICPRGNLHGHGLRIVEAPLCCLSKLCLELIIFIRCLGAPRSPVVVPLLDNIEAVILGAI